MGGNGRKAPAVWLVFLRGVLVSLGLYLLAAAVAALLAVRGTLPESGIFPVLAAGCFLAAAVGGLTCVRAGPWGSLPGAMLCAAGFLLVIGASALLCWDAADWLRGAVLLACGAAGGLLAGLTGGRRKRRRGGKRARGARRPERARS